MSYCCCSLSGTSACDHCANRPSEWSKPVYVINPPFTVDTTNFPPQEFVPVVRCKDCRYYITNYAVPHCGRTLIGMKKSDFCSYGERKEE